MHLIPLIYATTVVLMISNGRLITKPFQPGQHGYHVFTTRTDGNRTSQNLFDPYSLSHILHGFIFYALFHRFDPHTNFMASMVLECVWEVVENSASVIDKYRANTVSLDYTGDTVLNTTGDLISMAFGWWLAKQLPVSVTILAFAAIELLMVLVWRDNLFLNVLMLVYPIESVKQWQKKT